MQKITFDVAFGALNALPVDALNLLSPISEVGEYERALIAEEELGKLIAGDEHHPLAGVYRTLTANIVRYEDATYPIPAVAPHQMLDFLMDQQDVRQSDLAERLGVNQSSVSRLLRGQTAFTIDLMKKLSDIFHVPAGVFVG